MLGLLTWPSAAPAAPDWVPSTGTQGTVAADGARVEFDSAGNATAVWRERGGASQQEIRVAVRPPGGAFGASSVISGVDAFGPKLAVDPAGNAIAAWQWTDPTGIFRAQAAFRPAGGSFGVPVTLSAGGQHAQGIGVAIDGSGNALVVWQRWDGSKENVEASYRPVAGPFGPALAIGDKGNRVSDTHVAFDGAGNALAVWERFDGADARAQAALRPAAGPFGAPANLSASGQDASAPLAAIDAAGNALVVWSRSDGTNRRVEASFRPAGGAFGAATILSAAGQNADDPQVAFDDSGNALVAWRRGSPFARVESAFRPAGGAFGAATAFSDPGESALGPHLAFDGEGNALAVWRSIDGGGNARILGSFRPAGGSFGPAPALSGTPARDFPDVAMDPAGNGAAAWSLIDGRVQTRLFDGVPPTLDSVGAPSSGLVGESLSFSGSPFDWGGIAMSGWDFGDGQSSSGANVSHSYGAPGTYSAELSTTDLVGNTTTATRTVEISEPPADPPPPPPPPVEEPRALPGGSIVERVARMRVRRRGRSYLVDTGVNVTCRPSLPAGCGLGARLDRRRGARAARHVRIARRGFSVRSGQTRRLRIRVRGRQARLLRRVRRQPVRLTVAHRDDSLARQIVRFGSTLTVPRR